MPDSIRLTVELIEARLAERVGRNRVSVDADLANQLTGQQSPVVRVTPETEEEIVLVMQAATEHGLTVAPVGAGTQLAMGNVPQHIDLAVSSERLNRVLEYTPADMVVSVQPGVTLAELQGVLREHGQQLPLDPVVPNGATLGGLVATGVTGPLRTLYGTWRDVTIGLRTVYGDGRVVKAGGKVVKNVAGYDMTKLFIGSLGSLAFLSELAFKLRPLPAHVELCLLSGSAEQALHLSSKLVHSHLIASRMEAITGGFARSEQLNRPWVVAVESHESESGASYQTRQLTSWAAELGMDADVLSGLDADDFWTHYQQVLVPADLSLRLTAPPNQLMGVVEAIRTQLAELGLQARISAATLVGGARVYLYGGSVAEQVHAVQLCRGLSERQGGHAVVEKAPLFVRQGVDSFGPLRSDFPLIKGIKQTIDPNRRMSPGRFVGGI